MVLWHNLSMIFGEVHFIFKQLKNKTNGPSCSQDLWGKKKMDHQTSSQSGKVDIIIYLSIKQQDATIIYKRQWNRSGLWEKQCVLKPKKPKNGWTPNVSWIVDYIWDEQEMVHLSYVLPIPAHTLWRMLTAFNTLFSWKCKAIKLISTNTHTHTHMDALPGWKEIRVLGVFLA